MKLTRPLWWMLLGGLLVGTALAVWLWLLLVPVQNPATHLPDRAECGSLRDIQGYSKHVVPDDTNAPPWSGYTDSGLMTDARLKRECLGAATTAQGWMTGAGIGGAASLAAGSVLLVRGRVRDYGRRDDARPRANSRA